MSKKTLLAWACALSSLAGATQAATLIQTTELVASSPHTAELLPPTQTFTVATAGQYTLTLTDIRTPVALSALQAAVTRDLAVVAKVEVEYPTNPTEDDPIGGAITFVATPGEYRVHTIGEPAPDEVGGTFRINVAPVAGGTALLDRVEVIAAEPLPGDGQSVLRMNLNITAAGTYSLALTDLSFAPTTTTTQALLLQQTPAGAVVVPMLDGSFDAPAAGIYELIVVATAAGGDLTGLFGMKIEGGPSAAILYQGVHAAGKTPAPTVFNLPAGSYVLDVEDLEFPSAVSSFVAAVAQGDAVLARQSDDTSPSFTTLQAGQVQLFAVAVPNPDDGVAALNLQIRRGGVAVHSEIRTLDVSDDPASTTLFDVDSDSAVTAGTYTMTLKDFAFPVALGGVRAAVLQGTSLIDRLDLPGTSDVTLQTGPVRLLVAAKPRAASNGLFLARVVPAGGTVPVVASMQSVGGLGRSTELTITTAGAYDLTLADLEFPERLGSAALSVTDNESVKGQVFGSGSIRRLELTPGTYGVHFVGQAAANESYGLYALQVANSPPLPTVTLTATPSTITSGQTSTLQWSSANATSCSASGGWSGARETSGSQATATLNATATFSITCTGTGGSATAQATVTVNPPSASGGGAWGLVSLLGLISLLSARRLLARS